MLIYRARVLALRSASVYRTIMFDFIKTKRASSCDINGTSFCNPLMDYPNALIFRRCIRFTLINLTTDLRWCTIYFMSRTRKSCDEAEGVKREKIRARFTSSSSLYLLAKELLRRTGPCSIPHGMQRNCAVKRRCAVYRRFQGCLRFSLVQVFILLSRFKNSFATYCGCHWTLIITTESCNLMSNLSQYNQMH